MKIGIVTFQRAENFGAALQCRALYEYLRFKGHDVEIIDYRNPIIENTFKLLPKPRRNVLKYAASVFFVVTNISKLKRKKAKFHEAFRSIHRSRPYTKKELLDNVLEYDLIISGSDQIWNPKLTNGFDPIYFLQIPGTYRRASYSASLGNINLPQFEDKEFVEYLSTYDYLSVREENAATFLSRILNKRIDQTVDPTLLLNCDQWDNMIKGVQLPLPDKYIFVYDLLPDESIPKIAYDISKRYKMPVIHLISQKRLDIGYKSGTQHLVDVGPMELVCLIKNAEVVVSSSFHGASLSCVYKKNLFFFVPHERRGKDDRLSSLARLFGVQHRIVSDFEEYRRISENNRYQLQYSPDLFNVVLENSRKYIDTITDEIDGEN